MPASIDTEKEIDRAASGRLFEGFVQTLVAGISGAPNFVFQ